MRVFLYEFITGGGTWSRPLLGPPSGSLLTEGHAMIRALAADFRAAFPSAEIDLAWDTRVPHAAPRGCRATPVASVESEFRVFCRLAESADATIVIAPELAGALLERCRWAERAGARLASPDSRFVEIASDKHATIQTLALGGVPVPRGIRWHGAFTEFSGNDFLFPAVLKPCHGAGSVGVRRVERREELAELAWSPPIGGPESCGPESWQLESWRLESWRLESWCPGFSASVALICGPSGPFPLPACSQRLSEDGRLAYRGGETPLGTRLDVRARQLARAAIQSMPRTVGYVGVDLVLGADPTGEDDRVIEINPRLTTSYVGLRALARGNLAAAMMSAARGEPFTCLFDAEQVQFDASGQVIR